jgi:dUTP pyrophosphatase
MKIMLDKGAKMPTRAHPYDAGLDLYAMEEFFVPQKQSVTVDTGVHVEIPEGYVGLIKSKSGLMTRSCITTDGTIDSHYTGSIKVCLLNHSDVFHRYFEAGDKIAQLVIVPCLLPRLELVDSLEDTDRGDCGFGSTGR